APPRRRLERAPGDLELGERAARGRAAAPELAGERALAPALLVALARAPAQHVLGGGRRGIRFGRALARDLERAGLRAVARDQVAVVAQQAPQRLHAREE